MIRRGVGASLLDAPKMPRPVQRRNGELGEWFKPAVLKTADGQPSVSSNLTLSANRITREQTPSRFRVA
ncbi:conserved hypothetical protein [Burkholderiales bacterium 8X]|nr:conserved hypothetical protein [Burkholderiales bacterium 8X]